MTIHVAFLVLGAGVCAALGFLICFLVNRARFKRLNLSAKRIREEAESDAEKIRKQAELESKEEALRLKEELVAVFVGKAYNFVLKTGAVAWSNPFDDAGEHWGAIQIGPDNLVSFRLGMNQVTRDLRSPL